MLDDGRVYIGTWSGDVMALDAGSGRVRWTTHLGANPDETYGGPRGVIGSVAVAGDDVIAASGNCTVAALRALTGAVMWRVRVCDDRRNDDVYASPIVASGRVLVGVDLMDDRPTDRGREIALDRLTGRRLWTYEPARYVGMGAGVSSTPALDDRGLTAYIGSGNPLPRDDPPPGPDAGSDTIIALDVATGKSRWTFGPVRPHDTLDDDLFASPNRFRAGRSDGWRWLIGEGGKDAVYYAVDATIGRLAWKMSLRASASSMILGTAAVGRGAVFVPVYTDLAHGSINALRAGDGHVLWSRQTGGEYEAPLLWGATLFTTEAAGWLDVLHAGNGALVTRVRLPGPATGRGPSASQRALYVASGRFLIAWSLH